MVEREVKVIKIISENPGKSGNELYKLSVKQGFGINKSKFYKLLRDVRKLPEPSKEKKEQSIPIKYRKKPVRDLGLKEIKEIKLEHGQEININQVPIPIKKGKYVEIVVEIEIDGKLERFNLKHKNRKSLMKHYNKLKERYGTKRLKIFYVKTEFYHTFILDKWIEMLNEVGLQ